MAYQKTGKPVGAGVCGHCNHRALEILHLRSENQRLQELVNRALEASVYHWRHARQAQKTTPARGLATIAEARP